MEEERAAAYYDDLVKKGGGAARFKRGLGYGDQSSTGSSPNSTFVSFVKGDSHNNNLAAIEKEVRLATVREKLNKLSDAQDRRCQQSRSQDRVPVDHTSRINERTHEHRRRSRSRSRSHSSDSSHRRKKHWRSRSGSSSDGTKIKRRDRKHRSASRSSCESSGSSQGDKTRRRSPSGESRKTTHSRRRRTERLPSSRGDCPHRQRFKESHRSSTGRHRSRSESSKDERVKQQKASLKKTTSCDYTKLIPGFNDMSPAEKVRAKMKLQLSETVSNDTTKGMNEKWERFDFNKEAPLDDDAKLDYFGDGTGARNDTGFLQNTGSTFVSSSNQARRETKIQEAHEAAIFGPPASCSVNALNANKQHHGASYGDEMEKESGVMALPKTTHANSLLSDQVLGCQQGSWRERALKLKEQRAARTTS